MRSVFSVVSFLVNGLKNSSNAPLMIVLMLAAKLLHTYTKIGI
jgi:hypothetical protein